MPEKTTWRGRIALALAPKEVRALTANDAIKGLWTAMNTTTGVRVDEKTSLQIISVFTAVKILSEGFSQVPLKVYRAANDGATRTEARNHPMYGILHDWPNERMTAFAMREYWMMSLALWGNAYTQIIRNFRGEVVELWPLNPAGTRCERLPDGRVIYRTQINADPYGYSPGTKDIVLEEDEVFHIRGFSTNSLVGLSPIGMIRENVGLAAAYQEFAGRFFSNGGVPGFVLATDKPMQQQQLDLMHKEWAENYQGLTNAQKVAILHGGLKPEKVGIPPEDMQFIESRQFEREEIFSFYRIPPNFYSANRITSWGSGIKEMSVGFVKFTLDPWFVRVENAINAKFFKENAQGQLFPEFDREGFLRGDFPTRIQGYKDLFGMGVVSNQWIARTENLPEPPEEVYLVPNNMTPVDKVDAIADQQAAPPPAPIAPPPAQPQSDNAANRAALIGSQRGAFTEAVDRILRRGAFDIGQAKEKKSAEDFEKWLPKFKQDHLEFAAEKMESVVEGLAEVIRADVSRETGREVLPFPNLVRLKLEQIAERLAEEVGEADTVVERELMPLANDFAEVSYAQAGTAVADPVVIDGHRLLIAQRFVDKAEVSRTSVVINQPAPLPMIPPPAPLQPVVNNYTLDERSLERVMQEAEVKPEQVQEMIRANNEVMLTGMKEMLSGLVERMAPQGPPIVNVNFPEGAFKVEVAPPITNINKGAVEVNIPTTVHPAGPGGDKEITPLKGGGYSIKNLTKSGN